MKLRTKKWTILGLVLIIVMGIDLVVAWNKIHADQRKELEVDVHAIRGILMAMRRVYQQQFVRQRPAGHRAHHRLSARPCHGAHFGRLQGMERQRLPFQQCVRPAAQSGQPRRPVRSGGHGFLPRQSHRQGAHAADCGRQRQRAGSTTPRRSGWRAIACVATGAEADGAGEYPQGLPGRFLWLPGGRPARRDEHQAAHGALRCRWWPSASSRAWCTTACPCCSPSWRSAISWIVSCYAASKPCARRRAAWPPASSGCACR